MARALLILLLPVFLLGFAGQINGDVEQVWERPSLADRRVPRSHHRVHHRHYTRRTEKSGGNCVCDGDLDLILQELDRLGRELAKARQTTERPLCKFPIAVDDTIALSTRTGAANASVTGLLTALDNGNKDQAHKIYSTLLPEYEHEPVGLLQAALRLPEVIVGQVAQLLSFISTNQSIDSFADLSSRILEPSKGAKSSVSDVKNVVMSITKASEDEPIEKSTKRAELKLLNHTLASFIAAASENESDWKGVESWMGNDFFKIFRQLTKQEIFEAIVDSFKGLDKLSGPQLSYLEARYYDCADSFGIKMSMSDVRQHYFNFTRCNDALKSLSALPSSLSSDILDRGSSSTQSAEQILDERMGWVFSNYPTNGKDGQVIRPYPFIVNDDNLWLTYTLDAIIGAVDKGTVPCKLTCVAELLETLDPIQTGLSNYKFFTDLVTRNIRTHFSSTPEDIEPVMEYVDRLPYSLGKLGLTTLIPMIEGSVKNLKGDQPILLARQIINFELENETVWNEIPRLARDLASLSNKTAVEWKVKIGDEMFDIQGKEDNTLGIVPEGTKGDQVWVFNTEFDDTGAVFGVYLVDSKEEKYGRVHYHRGGDLRHELKSRPYGNYAMKINLLDGGSSFSLKYTEAEDPVCVVRDENGAPLKLGACRKEKEVAEFVMAKDPVRRERLLYKLFK